VADEPAPPGVLDGPQLHGRDDQRRRVAQRRRGLHGPRQERGSAQAERLRRRSPPDAHDLEGSPELAAQDRRRDGGRGVVGVQGRCDRGERAAARPRSTKTGTQRPRRLRDMWPFSRKALTATPRYSTAPRRAGTRTLARRRFPAADQWTRSRRRSPPTTRGCTATAPQCGRSWTSSSATSASSTCGSTRRSTRPSASRAGAPCGPVAALPERDVASDKFTRSMFKDFLLFDNAYALMEPAAGNQVSLNRMPAHMVEVRGASMFTAEGYRFHRRRYVRRFRARAGHALARREPRGPACGPVAAWTRSAR
jgi:hypothetical protein